MTKYNISEKEAQYFVFTGEISNQAYHQEKGNIKIVSRNGKIRDVIEVSDQLNLKRFQSQWLSILYVTPKTNFSTFLLFLRY